MSHRSSEPKESFDGTRSGSRPPEQQRRLARRFFVALLLLSGGAFLYMVRDFLIPILLAAVFTTLFFPWFIRLRDALGGRAVVASALACVIVFLGLIGPLWTVGVLVAQEAVELYGGVRERVQEVLDNRNSLLYDLEQTPWFQALGLETVDWPARIEEGAQKTAGLLAAALNKTAGGTFQLLIAVGVVLFSMFYFFIDGERLLRHVKYLSPLDERDETAIFQRFASTARATVRGTVVIALIQGTLGGLTLWAFGVTAPILWAVVMTVLAFIPIVGVKLVLLPAGILQMLVGEVWQGVAILLISFVVILNVDNVLRPRLVGSAAKMHDLVIFFATLGGLTTFGVAGLIVGPVLAAFVMSLLEIYSVQFRADLENPAPLAGPASPAGSAGTNEPHLDHNETLVAPRQS